MGRDDEAIRETVGRALNAIKTEMQPEGSSIVSSITVSEDARGNIRIGVRLIKYLPSIR